MSYIALLPMQIVSAFVTRALFLDGHNVEVVNHNRG
jgi:hypothetical protein